MKHIHQWRIYLPPAEVDPYMQQRTFFDEVFPANGPWTYRTCDCGAKMRCASFQLEAYPKDFRAFADEEWQAL